MEWRSRKAPKDRQFATCSQHYIAIIRADCKTSRLHSTQREGFSPDIRGNRPSVHHVSGTIPIPIICWRVEAKAIDLRQHAEHCRRLAKSSIDERTRIILRTMASEFDEQASDQEAGRKKPAPTQKGS